jgi:hypothetical protein
MTDEPVRRLLTEHLPAPPPGLTEPPLAAIRRRARRRTGTQVALAGVVVAAIAGGTAVWASDSDPGAPATGRSATPTTPTATTTTTAAMLRPGYLPPGYREVPGSGSETELRYLNPASEPPTPLVIRRLPAGTEVPAVGPAMRTVTVRDQQAEVLPIDSGGIALTWLEDGDRYSVSLEAPRNTQIDFVLDVVVDWLTAVAAGLR